MKTNENEGSGAYERSSVCADNVKTLRALKRYLCSLAVAPDGKVNVEQCRKCFRQCAYGKKYVKMSDEETEVAIEMQSGKQTGAADEKEDMTKLSKELAEEKRKRKEAEQERDELKAELSEMKEINNEMEDMNRESADERARLYKQLEKERAKCAELEAELEKAKKEVRAAEERLLEMDVEADRLRGEIRQLEAVNSTMADVEDGLEAEVLKLRNQMEEEKAERAGMEMRMIRMKAMLFDLEHPEVA